MWGNFMTERNMIREMLEEELDRNARAQKAYAAERDKLPRGSVTIKRHGNKAYCYLKYRDGSRVVTDYVGTAPKVETELRAAVARRKEIEASIKQLCDEQSYIEKALAL